MRCAVKAIGKWKAAELVGSAAGCSCCCLVLQLSGYFFSPPASWLPGRPPPPRASPPPRGAAARGALARGALVRVVRVVVVRVVAARPALGCAPPLLTAPP